MQLTGIDCGFREFGLCISGEACVPASLPSVPPPPWPAMPASNRTELAICPFLFGAFLKYEQGEKKPKKPRLP